MSWFRWFGIKCYRFYLQKMILNRYRSRCGLFGLFGGAADISFKWLHVSALRNHETSFFSHFLLDFWIDWRSVHRHALEWLTQLVSIAIKRLHFHSSIATRRIFAHVQESLNWIRETCENVVDLFRCARWKRPHRPKDKQTSIPCDAS